MTEESQVHVIRLEAGSFVWCFRCDSRIEGIGTVSTTQTTASTSIPTVLAH